MSLDRASDQHVDTWRSFTKLVQWAIGLVIVVIILLAFITL